jgi:hypothetical protein
MHDIILNELLIQNKTKIIYFYFQFIFYLIL